MIDEKLEIRYVIHSLNELEKLKMLLFDEDQHCVFERIPKPFLIDGVIAESLDDKTAPKNPSYRSYASIISTSKQNPQNSKISNFTNF